MDNNSLEYFLSLLDDAKRVIEKDFLAEEYQLLSYTIEKEVEKKLSLKDEYLNCHSCDSWMNRTHLCTIGKGSKSPLILFVLDRVLPNGAFITREDAEYLNKWSDAIKLDKIKECYLTSIIKCPINSDQIPPDCITLLEKQVDILKPKVIFFLGELGAKLLNNRSVKESRNGIYEFRNTKALVSYSPRQVLDDLSKKPEIWEDLKRLSFYASIEDRRCK